MHEPGDPGIRSWPHAERPFVRVTMRDGQVLYGRASRWKNRTIFVDFPAPPDDVWGNWGEWFHIDQVERVPGELPECKRSRFGGHDDPDVLWSPNQCAWPRGEDGTVKLFGTVEFFPRAESK